MDNAQMDELEFFSQQSLITDPGEYRYLYENLPRDINELCLVLHRFLIHVTDGPLYNYKIPESKLRESNLRFVTKMLAKIVEQGPADLLQERTAEQKLCGTCRDFSCLLCSILRYQGIPARLRVGFASYIFKNTTFKSDHVVLEYWKAEKNNWYRVDPRISPLHIQKNTHHIDFDLYDVPENKFFVASQAWRLCRTNQYDPDQFGYGFFKTFKGWWYLRNKCLQDLAALNRKEPLLWDAWGCMLQQQPNEMPSQEQNILLDKLCLLTSHKPLKEFKKIIKLYNHPFLKIPEKFLSFSPTAGVNEIMFEEGI